MKSRKIEIPDCPVYLEVNFIIKVYFRSKRLKGIKNK
jgi:hypothetical protein